MVATSSSILDRVLSSANVTTSEGLTHLSFLALGTQCRISFNSQNELQGKTFMDRSLEWTAAFEAKYSRFIPDSLISQINQNAGKTWVEVDEESERIFSLCQELWFLTQGAFDPTALPVIQLWNWKVQPVNLPDNAAVTRAKDLVGWRKVERKRGSIFLPKPGMCLDLGGIGKEYAVDIVMAIANENGVKNVLIDFGHDVRAQGCPPARNGWHVGLEDPRKPGSCWGGVLVKNQAVASSGDYLRHFQKDGRRYGHIVDPRTGYPVFNDCRAVTVIAPNCTVAGILSTTAFVLGAKAGLSLIENYFGAEGSITTENTRLQTTRFCEYVAS